MSQGDQSNQDIRNLLGKLGASSNTQSPFDFSAQTNRDFLRQEDSPLSSRLLDNREYLKSNYGLNLNLSDYGTSAEADRNPNDLSINSSGYDPLASRTEFSTPEDGFFGGLSNNAKSLRNTFRGNPANRQGRQNQPTTLNKRNPSLGAMQTDLNAFLYGIPQNIDESATFQTYGNGVQYGGNEVRYGGSINDQGRNIARSGIIGGQSSDRTGNIKSDSQYDFSVPLTYESNSDNASQFSQGNTNFSGGINANLTTPNSFDYNQSIGVTSGGSSGIAQQSQTGGQGDQDLSQQQTGGAQTPLDILSGILLGGGKTTTTDLATTQAQGGIQNSSQGTLTSPGNVDMSQNSSTNQQSTSTSPVFGSESNSNVANQSNSNQNLNVSGQNSEASAGSAVNQGSNANETIQNTQVQTGGGLIPGTGGNFNTTDVNSNSNSQLQGQNEAQSSGQASAQSNNQAQTQANTGYTNTNVGVDQNNQTNSQGGQGASIQDASGQANATSQTTANYNSAAAGSGTPLENLGKLLLGSTTVLGDSVQAGSGIGVNSATGSEGNNQSQTSTTGQASSGATSSTFGNQVNTDTQIGSQGNSQTAVQDPNSTAVAGTGGTSNANASGSVDQTNITTGGGLLQGFGKKTQTEIDAELAAQAQAASQSNIDLSGNASGQANQGNSAYAAATNSLGGNIDVGAQTNTTTTGQTSGVNTNLQGQSSAGAQGQVNQNYNSETGQNQNIQSQTQANSELIASLQGQGASTEGVSQAQAALSGSMGAQAQTQVQIQAKRFITDLEQALPNDPVAQAAIERMKQDPSLVWLFDGSNSPKSIIEAIANSGTSQTTQRSTGGGDWLVQRDIATGNAQSNITIDPNNPTSNGAIRYYQDPQTGKTFANVQGQVREVKQGELVPIDFTDQFSVNAQARAQAYGVDLASNELNVDGSIKGSQYYYAGNSQDQIYDQLAKEAIARQTNTFQGQARPEQARTVDWTSFVNGGDEANFDRQAYLRANPDVAAAGMDAWSHFAQYGYREGRQYTPVASAYEKADQANAQEQARYNQQLAAYQSSYQNPDDPYNLLKGLLGKDMSAEDLQFANDWITQEAARRQELANSGQTDIDTEVDWNDLFADQSNQPLIDRYGQYASNPDFGFNDRGQIQYKGRAVNEYQQLLELLGNERTFDQERGYSQGGNYIDLNNVNSSGMSNNALAQHYYLPKQGWDHQQTFNDGNLTINGVDVSQDPTFLQNLLSQNQYGPLNFATNNFGTAEQVTNMLNTPWAGNSVNGGDQRAMAALSGSYIDPSRMGSLRLERNPFTGQQRWTGQSGDIKGHVYTGGTYRW